MNSKSRVHCDYAMLNIKHSFTALQQVLWHHMLLFASNQLGVIQEHKISLARLVSVVNLKSSHDIKDKILTMGKEPNNVETNDVFSYYFSEVKIVKDTVYYSYPPHLTLLLSHPCVWEVTKQLVQMQFSSKYSLFLCEFALYYKILKCEQKIHLDELRRYLGLSSYQYKTPKTFHRSIITPSLYEINQQTPLTVLLRYEKDGTAVSGIKISILEKYSARHGKVSSELPTEDCYGFFLQNTAYARYYRLSQEAREIIDRRYDEWAQERKQQVPNQISCMKEILKKLFLVEQCIAPYEQNIDLWA